ncbi:MAG: glycosyltransferase family 2 protein [Myxococcota bacterium]
MTQAANDRAPRVSVVVPVYRSARTLPELVRRLAAVLDAEGLSHELILVDDGSPDESWSVLREIHEEMPDRVVAVELMRNFGQHNALMCGLGRARGEVVVTLDDDLQHPPEEIPKLLGALDERGLDLAYGLYDTKRHDRWRNAGSWLLTSLYMWLFQVDVPFASFRAIRRDLVRSVLTYSLNFTFLDGLLAWNTARIGAVEVEHAERSEGASGYSISKLLRLSLNLLTNFSLIPLQFVSLVGLLAATGGIGLGLVFLVAALTGRMEVPGYASTIVAVLMLGGVQLLALGIMGEYLGRVHLNINRKPQYVERRALETVGESGGDAGSA